MIHIKNYTASSALAVLLAVTVLIAQSCKQDTKKEKPITVAAAKEKVIEIVTEDMEFQMPDTIASGWNTFRYTNKSSQPHFFLIEKYPKGKTIADAKSEIVPYFSSGMKFINEGQGEQAMAEFGKLPEWYGEVQLMGGSGLVSANKTATTTLKLEPGYYIVECYVKMSNGVFHTTMGMIEDLVVAEEKSGNKEGKADVSIVISSEKGIIFQDSISSGKYRFSVTFNDQIQHENFVGHDVNLVKVDKDAALTTLESWMNWATPTGLKDPAPEGFTFLGGVNDMPAGSHGYFTATLKPGMYALVSEVPNSIRKKLLKTFIVTD